MVNGSSAPYSAEGRFTSLLLANAEGKVELTGCIGLTIHVSDSSQIERRQGGKVRLFTTQVASTFVDVPGSEITVAVRRRVAVLQTRISIERVQLLASEDHECCPAIERLAGYRCDADFELLRLALLSRRGGSSGSLIERELVRRLVLLTGGKVIDLRGGLSPVRLRRLYDLVDARLVDVTLSQMANEVALSPHHFSREFKRATGLTPWEYVTGRKLARAVDLLRLTNSTVAEIASRCGFRHASHLSRHLQAKLHIAPADLREVLRGRNPG